MPHETITFKQSVTSVDISTMENMSMDDYQEYLQFGLLFVDHHDILRSEPADYPLATNKKQLRALINHLSQLEFKLKD
jgi:hypothetical protein